MEETSNLERKISEIEAELVNLDHRRSEALVVLAQLRQELLQKNLPTQSRLNLVQTSIHNQSSQEEKIRLFRSLFKRKRGCISEKIRKFKNWKNGLCTSM